MIMRFLRRLIGDHPDYEFLHGLWEKARSEGKDGGKEPQWWMSGQDVLAMWEDELWQKRQKT